MESAMKLIIRRQPRGATFIHPMDPTPRTAILAPGFKPTKLVRVFSTGWSEAAARFKPCSIAAPVEQLRRIAPLHLQLSHSVIVFTFDGGAGLSEDDRDLFWDSFGVPVFEEHLDRGNRLLAMECEAHAGLHIMGNFESLRLDRNSCVCGNPAPRFPRRARIHDLAEMLT
jgi:hypothetical protein